MRYVDLGLPSGTLWSDCWVGSKHIYEHGSFSKFKDVKNKYIPTKEQCRELDEYCNWQIVILNRRKAFQVIGPNGNCIYMTLTGGKSLFYKININRNRCFRMWCINGIYSRWRNDIIGFLYDYIGSEVQFSTRLVKSK